jgi:hypothetical protein
VTQLGLVHILSAWNLFVGGFELICSHCNTESADNVRVCIGCKAEVVHGASPREMKRAAALIAMLSAIAVGLFAHFFDTDYGLEAYIKAAIIGAVLGAGLAYFHHRGSTRFFRYYWRK